MTDELPEFFRGQLSRCYRIAEKIVVYISIHTMVDASLLADANVTYFGHKYEDAAREEEKGKQVRALGKKERCKSCWRFPSRAVHSKQIVRVSAFSGSRVSRGGLRVMSPAEYLTIIPRARMGSESIAHKAEGRMGY